MSHKPHKHSHVAPPCDSAYICEEACGHSKDGVCDDGGPPDPGLCHGENKTLCHGSLIGTTRSGEPLCKLGTDCEDCGKRCCEDDHAWSINGLGVYTCAWYRKKDPGCLKYNDDGQLTKCPVTCRRCGGHATQPHVSHDAVARQPHAQRRLPVADETRTLEARTVEARTVEAQTIETVGRQTVGRRERAEPVGSTSHPFLTASADAASPTAPPTEMSALPPAPPYAPGAKNREGSLVFDPFTESTATYR